MGYGLSMLPNLILRLVKEGWAPDVLININFPNVSEDNVKGISVTFQGKGGLGSMLELWGRSTWEALMFG